MLRQHEEDLFNRNILQLEPDQDFNLIYLEQTLLSLGSLKDVTKGVFYSLAFPSKDGFIVRYTLKLSTICISIYVSL